jgi:hypothetical protein
MFKIVLLSFKNSEEKQEKRCTYNVTFRRARATILAVQTLCVLRIISVLF